MNEKSLMKDQCLEKNNFIAALILQMQITCMQKEFVKDFEKKILLAVEMGKTQILMNKTAYLCLSILGLSETVTYEFWFDYEKPKYDEKAKLCIWIQTISLFI